VRTETGKEFFEEAVASCSLEARHIEEEKHSLELLTRLSAHDKQNTEFLIPRH
jgi:coenzyme F420-reducing hydrogenase beta subunit